MTVRGSGTERTGNLTQAEDVDSERINSVME